MVTTNALMNPSGIRALLEEVREELLLVDEDHGSGIIALPQTYPGGTSVVVRVRRDGDRYIVTDDGIGYQEAEHMGGLRIFGRLAPEIAENHGIKFDGMMMFAVEVDRDWLANAIIFTGSASRRAVEKTAEKLAEEREGLQRNKLRDRIKEVFASRATFDVEVRGRSTKNWHFAAMVEKPDHSSLFDLVTPHHVSIASAIVKFQDISRLEDSPRGVIVLSNRKRTDAADITMLSQAAGRVLDLEANRKELIKAA